MPDLSLAGEWATHFHLSFHASHFVLEGEFLLMSFQWAGTILAVVIKIVGPTMTPAIRDCTTFGIDPLCSARVCFLGGKQ